MKTDDPRKPDAMVVAYFGSYTVDEAGKKITGKIEGSELLPEGQYGNHLDRAGRRGQADPGRLAAQRPTRNI